MNVQIVYLMALLLGGSAASLAQAANAPDVRAAIRAGNAAWVRGMEQGNAQLAASMFASDAVFCGQRGPCVYGHDAIERLMAASLKRAGRAKQAVAVTKQLVRDGDLVYEWGYASDTLGNGVPHSSRYLAVWQLQKDGEWKICRNLVLPAAP